MISTDISRAVSLLENDELVAIPTETVYGLAGNAFSQKAINKIFRVKNRPLFNPLILHIKGLSELHNIALNIPQNAIQLAKAFWPGPLTLVLPKKDNIPDGITAGKNTVAVRVPNHPLTLKLLAQLDVPLCAPSANPFNRISPTKAEHVKTYFKHEIPLILDGGACKKGIESTIVGFEGESPIIYRYGSISIEDLKAIVGDVKILNQKNSSPEAPGMLNRHYAPKTKMILSNTVADTLKVYTGKRIGVISFYENYIDDCVVFQVQLSKDKDMVEAASRLYDALHEIDSKNLDIIIAEKFPNESLGVSINDRLCRATQ